MTWSRPGQMLTQKTLLLLLPLHVLLILKNHGVSGRNLYLSKEINCLNCHGYYGKGDGPQSTDFEKNAATGEVYGEAGLHDAWGNINQPRNLTEGIYRGGRRPIDIFRRINAGIKGTAMPSFSKNLTDEQTWHIVNYVLSIPFEPEPGNTSQPAAESSTASL